jgi:aldose 1-epimerase
MAPPKHFGTLADGRSVRSATLEWTDGLAVEVLEYGAAVRSLRAPTPAGPIETILGFPTLEQYEADAAYQGVVVGRVANRIAGAAFGIDDRRFEVTANEGPNTLHGGPLGLSRRLWRFGKTDQRRVVLAYTSPDGEEGFPGILEARVIFTLTGPDTLEIAWEARTDRPTPVNLTHHLYFNLSGDPSRGALDHALAIRAGAITPVRPDLIPTGEKLPVEGTPFDLRMARRLGEVLSQPHAQLALVGGYDHNWVLASGDGPDLVLRSPETDLSLFVTTDQPGVQIYTGQALTAPFAPYGGIAIEPQNFPDAVNQPGFPDPILRPGQLYRRASAYRFEAGVL